jgi:cobalt/nickel transport system permease protein
MSVVFPTWAVHVSDGVLGWPWLAAGFAVAAALALLAAWRVREDDVPRIGLMTAAFFVASSIHVRLGPTSAHLLLNALVGVVLGARAPLAILVGVVLQALLIPHGGLTTIGVNTCTEALPALLAGALFPVLHRAVRAGSAWGSLLTAAAAVLWGGCLVFVAALLLSNPLSALFRWSSHAGLVVSWTNEEVARRVLLHPLTLAGLAALALAAVLLQRRLRTAPEFPLGAFLGVTTVLETTALLGAVLLADGSEQWSGVVHLVFVAHLPVALVEGLILGCTVAFLARVKPEMLGLAATDPPAAPRSPLQQSAPTAVASLLVLLLSAGPALAHRLLAEHRVDPAGHKVVVESWYETNDAPADAAARVTRADGSVLASGPLNAKGVFVFTYERPEPLTVEINAPGGHRAVCKIAAKELEGAAAAEVTPEPAGPHSKPAASENRFRDLAVGLALVLGLSSFAMSWLNHRRLRTLAEKLGK